MTFSLDFRPLQPTIRRVELLTHPQIPGPLGGVNPRTVLGDTWWDEVRRNAYAANNYHCHACAGDPDDDPLHQSLDAHECYDIDWQQMTATYTETVALCRSCHSFIHAGRSVHVLPREDLVRMLARGLELLRSEDLMPYWRTYVIILEFLEGMMPRDAVAKARSMGLIIPYDAITPVGARWWLVVNGTRYRRNEYDGTITTSNEPGA